MKTLIGLLTLVLALPAVLQAQKTIDGRWEGQTPNRQAVALELTAKAEELTGTMTVGGEKAAIENGKVSKTGVSFTVAMGGATGFTGELKGDELKIWMDDRGPAAAITLKRAK